MSPPELPQTSAAKRLGRVLEALTRLTELATSYPGKLLTSAQTLDRASERERAHWSPGETVILRGHEEPTRLAHGPSSPGTPESPQIRSEELG